MKTYTVTGVWDGQQVASYTVNAERPEDIPLVIGRESGSDFLITGIFEGDLEDLLCFIEEEAGAGLLSKENENE